MEDNNVINTTNANQTSTEPAKTSEQIEAEKKAAFEAEEAKRKAEWEAKKAERDEQELIEWEMATLVTPDTLVANAAKRVATDTERITRRNMKECVSEDILQKLSRNPDLAKHALHPRKNMFNCFKYINRKAKEYLQEEMKNNGEKPDANGMYGGDVPDDLCYMWGIEYFTTFDLPEDKKEGEEDFVPKTYRPSCTPKSTKKSTSKKKEIPPPKEEPKKAEESAQMSLF